MDRKPGIMQNPWFTDRSGLGNLDCRVNHPDVLRKEEEPSREHEQVKKHVVMVGSWSCKMSSEVHINGRRVSGPVREDKGNVAVLESEDEKDPKRTRKVLSKGHKVVRPGYSRLSGDAARVTDRRGESGNPNRGDGVHGNTTRIGGQIGLLGTAGVTGMDTQVGKQIGLLRTARVTGMAAHVSR
jgi:hypothetical protein